MLEVEVATTSGTATCSPKGDLDATTLSTFRGAVGLCLGEPGLIVDLSGVHFSTVPDSPLWSAPSAAPGSN